MPKTQQFVLCANYLANGNLTDRTTSSHSCCCGNVTIKETYTSKVMTRGNEISQTALRVSNGTLHLEDGSQLVAYGGSGKTLLYREGGVAIDLDNATIDGNGKVTAIGGDVLWGNGGNAVTMMYSLYKICILRGATANGSNKAEAGKATDGTIKVTGQYRHMEDGTVMGATENDPLAELYWKTGIDAQLPLDKFETLR